MPGCDFNDCLARNSSFATEVHDIPYPQRSHHLVHPESSHRNGYNRYMAILMNRSWLLFLVRRITLAFWNIKIYHLCHNLHVGTLNSSFQKNRYFVVMISLRTGVMRLVRYLKVPTGSSRLKDKLASPDRPNAYFVKA